MNKKNLITIFIISLFIIISYLPSETEAGCCFISNDYKSDAVSADSQEACDRLTDHVSKSKFYPDRIAKDEACVSQNETSKEIKKADPIKYNPQISIPESEFTAGKTIEIPASARILANYVIAIFKYLIGVVGIIAAIVLMFAGIRWLTASGNQAAIGEAKKYIFSSLTGLILALGSFLLLSTINTNLVNLQVPEIQYIEYTGLDDIMSDEEYERGKNVSVPGPIEDPVAFPAKTSLNSMSESNVVLTNYNNDKFYKLVNKIFDIYPALGQSMQEPKKNVDWFGQRIDSVRRIDYSRQDKKDCVCIEPNKITKNEECGSKGDHYSNMETSGCGLASLFMIAAAWGSVPANNTSYQTYAKDITKYMPDNGYRKCGSGSQYDGLIAYAKTNFGLNVKKLGHNWKEAEEFLRLGYPIMASIRTKTGGGHYIVMHHMDNNGNIHIKDPYKLTKEEVANDFRTKNDIKFNNGMFLFYKGSLENIGCKDPGESCESNTECCEEKACYYNMNNKKYQCSNKTKIQLNQYGCNFKNNDCDNNLKCLFDGSSCDKKFITHERCHRCSDSCIGDDQFGCHQNNDCCSKKCNTKDYKCMPSDYGCNFKNLTPCATGKCLFDGGRCSQSQINNTLCHRCINACIGNNQFGCHKNDDCCSNKCSNNKCYN